MGRRLRGSTRPSGGNRRARIRGHLYGRVPDDKKPNKNLYLNGIFKSDLFLNGSGPAVNFEGKYIATKGIAVSCHDATLSQRLAVDDRLDIRQTTV